MRAVRAVVRAFVYGTEDEQRVVGALLDVLGRTDDPGARGRLTRTRVKSHYGTEILLFEAVLKQPRDLRAFFDRVRSSGPLLSTLREEFTKRMDEEHVLHFRLDKQAAVRGRLELGLGGDAITADVKYGAFGNQPPQGFPFD